MPGPTSQRPAWTWAVPLGAAAGLLWIAFALVLYIGTDLRPIADDYCHAEAGFAGYLPSIITWYRGWIGDLFQVAFTAGLVGQTLAYLPLQLASLIPFALTLLGISGLVVLLLRPDLNRRRAQSMLIWAGAIPAVALLWLAFWWLPATLNPSQVELPWLLATAITDWQTVNVQYVLVPALLIAAWLVIAARRGTGIGLWIAYGLLGLFSGMAGLVFGIAALGFVIVHQAGLLIWRRRLDRRQWPALAFLAGCLIGLAISYFAPGTLGRNALLVDARPLGPHPGLADIVAWTFPQSVATWLTGLVQSGALMVFVVSIGIGVAAARLNVPLDTGRIARSGAGLLVFSLIVAVVQRAGDGFSYMAHWHDVLTRTVIFVAVVALGYAVGGVIASAGRDWLQAAAAVAAAVALVAGMGSLFSWKGHVEQRAAAWAVGAAPAGAQDIETDWAQVCWHGFKENRPDLPDR